MKIVDISAQVALISKIILCSEYYRKAATLSNWHIYSYLKLIKIV